MALCNACNSFFENTFIPPQHKPEYSWMRTDIPHKRMADVVKSAAECRVCALIKFCSIRAFSKHLRDESDSSFLDFVATAFADEPISLTMDRAISIRSPPKSKAILARFPEPIRSTEHRGLSQNVHLSLWAAKGTPAALSSDVCDIRPIRDDGSSESFQKIATWLNNCVENHQACNDTLCGTTIDERAGGSLPTRVIDVTPLNDTGDVRLVKTNGSHGHYVALSHCWGPPEKQPIRTLRGNLQQHLTSIPSDKLPRTFADAIRTTRAVGIKYLWIDSLCIVQDDESDWEREAKTMGALYEKARFTIAATDATDSSQGLFLAGRLPDDLIVEVPYVPNGKHAEGAMFVSAGSRSYYAFSFDPLGERAWVFQERYLSRRILHCTASGLIWFCKAQWTGVSHYTVNERGLSQLGDSVLTRSWQEDVQEFTERRLTYERDRLAAVQGLATEIGRRRSDRYYFGAWTNELPCNLLWLRIRQFVLNDLSDIYQPNIPSWSWAALPGRKWFVEDWDIWDTRLMEEKDLLDLRRKQPMKRSLVAETTAGENGSLFVDSYLKKAVADEKTYEMIDGIAAGGSIPADIDGKPPIPLVMFLWHGAYSIVDEAGRRIGRAAFDIAFTSDFYCLFLCNGQPIVETSEKEWCREDWFHYVLLLQQLPGTQTFRRVGLGLVTQQTWLDKEDAQRVHII